MFDKYTVMFLLDAAISTDEYCTVTGVLKSHNGKRSYTRATSEETGRQRMGNVLGFRGVATGEDKWGKINELPCPSP